MVYVEKALRLLFSLIDGVCGWAVGELYKLIVQIANVDIFGSYIYTFMNRIYVFLAVFMIFKLSVSVVNYILNPDQLSDKSKGFGKLIQNVIIVIALIIFVPQIFDWGYKLQSMILNTNVLYTVVTGKQNSATMDYDDWINLEDDEKLEMMDKNAQDAGNMIKYELMSSFITSDIEGGHAVGNNRNSYNDTCYARNIDRDKPNYQGAFDCLLESKTINNTKNGKYGFTGDFANEYRWGISTLCMGFTAYIFIVFCFDAALRCVRLGVLQLIAPIPIISRLDPGSEKNGMFGKWLKDCTSTYLSLFIRLLAIYFAIEIIMAVTGQTMKWRDTGIVVSFLDYPFVKIFIILGALMFAKQVPQFVESLVPGFKMDAGGMSLKKKLGGVPGLNRATAGAMGFAGGLAANAYASRNLYKGEGFKGFAKGLGSSIAGATSGTFRGLTSKEKDAWKAGRGAIKGAVDARNLRAARYDAGVGGFSGFINRRKDGFDQFVGINHDQEKFEKERNKEVFENIAAQEARAEKQIKAGQAGDLSAQYFEHTTKVEQLKGQLQTAISQQQNAREQYMNAQAAGDTLGMNKYSSLMNQFDADVEHFRTNLAKAQAEETALVEDLTYKYIDEVKDPNNARSDGTLETLLKDYDSFTDNKLFDKVPDAKGRHSQGGRLRGRNADIDREMQKETVRKGFNDKK